MTLAKPAKNPPKVGENILRPVRRVQIGSLSAPAQKLEVSDVNFKTNDRGTHVFRAYRNPDIGMKYTACSGERGLICFVLGDIPEGWTHFEIVRVGREATSVIVEARVADVDDLLEAYGSDNLNQELVDRVIEVIEERPDLIAPEHLAAKLTQDQILAIFHAHLDLVDRFSEDECARRAAALEKLVEIPTKLIGSLNFACATLTTLYSRLENSRYIMLQKKVRTVASDIIKTLKQEGLHQ